MPRRKINHTHEYPYHVYARSNNQENFYLDLESTWEIFVSHLSEIKLRFHCEIYAFVMMSNHYHLLIKTSEEVNLAQIMHWFQMSVSRKINTEAGRINHVFGGPYQCTQITSNHGFQNVFKYIYRNPIRAHICKKVEDYDFSLLNRDKNKIVSSKSLVEELISSDKDWMEWLNSPTQKEHDEIIKKTLAKKIYKPSVQSIKLRRGLLEY